MKVLGDFLGPLFLLLIEMLEKPISVCDCGISRSYSLTFFV